MKKRNAIAIMLIATLICGGIFAIRGPEHAHAYSAEDPPDVGEVVTCPICGRDTAVIMSVTRPDANHDGVYFWGCEQCGTAPTDPNQPIVPSTGYVVFAHDYQHAYTVAPTCTTGGYDVYRCSRIVLDQDTGDIYCNDEYYDNYTAAAGHNWQVQNTKPATCTDAGNTHYICAACGAAKDEPIPATGHKPVTDKGTEATCTDEGLTEGSHCEVCNAVITKQEVIPALGHQAATDSAKEATCTDEGLTEGAHCEVCSTVLTEQTAIPALGHDWDEGAITKEATEKEAGIRTFTCRRCGETKTEEIPRLGNKKPPVIIAAAVAAAGIIGAAAAAISRKKRLKLKKPELSKKSIMLALDESAFDKIIKLFVSKRYISASVEDTDDDLELAKKVKENGPDLVILGVTEENSLELVQSTIKAVNDESEGTFAVLVKEKLLNGLKTELDKMVGDKTIIGYSGDESGDNALVRMVLPIYKPELITLDGTLDSAAKIADALDIPVVSSLVRIRKETKNIKETLEKDPGLVNASSIVGSIASIFGWDGVEEITDFISDVDDAKGKLGDEIERQKVLNDYGKDKKEADE